MIMHWRSFLWLFPLLPTFYCETQSAVFAADGKVHMDDKRGFKPWIRRQDGAAMELEELRENQAPQVSPALAKAMLSAETHKSGTLAGLQTALVAEQATYFDFISTSISLVLKASASTASALLVISEFTFFLMMLYLLNHKDVNVKRLSWSTLHSSVAIFISMLLFMSTKSLWILMAGHTLDGTPAGVALSWTRYVVVWILGPVILLRRGVDDESREAWCSIVQWFTAFCGADAFGELMMTSVFSASVGAQFGGFILCCFIIWLQCFGLERSWSRTTYRNYPYAHYLAAIL
eukprot:g9481.t1